MGRSGGQVAGQSGGHGAVRWQGVQVDQYWGSGQVVRLPGEQAVGQSC